MASVFDNPRDRYRLQDWAFVQGFARVKESSRSSRWILHCIHYHDQTRDFQKISDMRLYLKQSYDALFEFLM